MCKSAKLLVSECANVQKCHSVGIWMCKSAKLLVSECANVQKCHSVGIWMCKSAKLLVSECANVQKCHSVGIWMCKSANMLVSEYAKMRNDGIWILQKWYNIIVGILSVHKCQIVCIWMWEIVKLLLSFRYQQRGTFAHYILFHRYPLYLGMHFTYSCINVPSSYATNYWAGITWNVCTAMIQISLRIHSLIRVLVLHLKNCWIRGYP